MSAVIKRSRPATFSSTPFLPGVDDPKQKKFFCPSVPDENLRNLVEIWEGLGLEMIILTSWTGREGRVFLKTKEMSTNKIYFIKALPHPTQNAISRALRERALARDVSEQFVVPLLECVQADKWLILFYPFTASLTISKIIPFRKGLPLPQAIFLFYRLVEAIAHLHAGGVAHGDLKPNNTLIDEHSRVRLIDLEFSSVVGRAITARAGTPQFMAPEISGHKPFLPENADAWALGVFFYKILTGRLPFIGWTIDAVKENMGVPPAIPANLPRRERGYLLGLLEKNPDKRLRIEDIEIPPYFPASPKM